MLIIFLDIDGVLVTARAHDGKTAIVENFDTEAVKNFNRLIRKTRAKIVISSAWRYSHKLPELKSIFKKWKVQGTLIDTTPQSLHDLRGKEIKSWIRKNKYKGEYLVIDDCVSDITPYIAKKRIVEVPNGWNLGGFSIIDWKYWIK